MSTFPKLSQFSGCFFDSPCNGLHRRRIEK